MDGNGLPIIGPSVDKTKIEPIHQKRLIAFINHFLTTTVSFLNTFSHSVETRLEKCEGQLQKMDAALCILEAKLNSIAGLEDVLVATPEKVTENPPEVTPPPPPPAPVAPVTDVPSGASEPQANNATPAQTKISQDPQYSRFFRMVAVGVPLQAVKQKMQVEGLDPGILDDPDAPAPTNTSLGGVSVTDEKPDDSDSSFSD
uniref:WASH complex subunit 3 n=1 Tax=Timema genevievae TaxID=629358 RepID=A0A7R9JVN6_TIMGE|nr:unnamed protein product [Timema genevievae]